ncbi:MAG: hypothetical protein JWM10_3829 [Myxococcaceae bacterium]|nr:hypothetical protein [Myxococcaceae bacterium]
MTRTLLCSTVALTLLASCADEAPVRPAMLSGDAAFVFSDASVVGGDVGVATDRGAATDAAGATDAVRATDVGNATDTGAASDAGGATDAGAASDAGATSDRGTATDAGSTASDVGSTATDVGSTATDAGSAATDAGVCAAGATSCATPGGGRVCANLTVETAHCGSCDVQCCGVTDRCVAGVCTSRCPTLMESCPAAPAADAGCVATRCVDVSVDDLNCGACGHACADGEGCVSGHCI